MEYQALAKDILSHVGGKENIGSLVHCHPITLQTQGW